ncbi:DNA sulfur modification protein DndB [Halalkalibacter urbisdiaboli]|uniref:DNA sulfur modification protein DndB n=1 Tax=Halalkalibacter urbisdiaboli TaxID=1960589 RepID=UPI000B437637|nr:DNA sulfur modification protein DndB [Halalkalibacter urbisdiaboli]
MGQGFSYNFPSLRGVQAGRAFYVAMVPLRLIPKIFLFDEEDVPAEHRAQRILNKSRIPEITNYILENHKEYVFSSLTASIDGNIEFQSLGKQDTHNDLGNLIVSLDSKFLIIDGQHRRAAIEEALKISPELGGETISVVFFHDQGLKKTQQLFADLNRHAINTTSSIGILYDHRDQLAMLTKDIIKQIPLLNRYTDNERVSLSKNSPKLFSLNSVFNTNQRLLGKKKGEFVTEQEKEFLFLFWELLSESITEWQQVSNKAMSPRELRMNFIVGHGVFMEAIGILGNYLYFEYPSDWKQYIVKLEFIDWSRTNYKDWLDRAFNQTGRIVKNNQTVQLTANQIKFQLNLPLTEKEKEVENILKQGV